jgi:hypothetical protein
MKLLIKSLAAVATGVVLAASALAQTPTRKSPCQG